ncbi:MAG: 3-dehydroquinate synthase [Lachnospiraceae bacterium]|nr:3-dehydroquinate synthase [Lachnospiraceae bacterium]
MKKEITVQYEGKDCYKICITESFDSLNDKLEEAMLQSGKKVCVVSDDNVASFYIDKITSVLKEKYNQVFSFVFKAGEASKNTETVGRLYEHLIKNRFDRNDFLIALGGGVVGDLTGFAAATYLRGIDFVQVPTSLLAQVDSSIGGKTGVDHMQYKNMVGAFHMPKLVYMNMEVFETLPGKQFSNGMGEVIKHGLIKDEKYYRFLKSEYNSVIDKDFEALTSMIETSCNIKREVVEKDPKEKGERALLNFGHTIGHAIEKLSDFSLLHGECVSLGIVAASYISMKKGYLTAENVADIEALLKLYGLPVRVKGYDASEVLSATKNDKKMVGNKIKFILLKNIGEAFIDTALEDSDILEGIKYVVE